MHDDGHDHDRGLAHDLQVLTTRFAKRRQMLRWLGGATLLLPAAACVDSVIGGGGAGGSGGGTTAGDETCSKIPEETAGPYPGDGSNGKNVLTVSGIVRSDIRSSIGSASGVAEGIPLEVTLKLVSASGCGALSGYAIYLWHCDRDGNYSMYSQAVANENYLRGVQETDDSGEVTFTTIFPACYSGRWPHIHFEVYRDVDAATSSSNKLATSQLALPESACDDVFATDGYEASIRNMEETSLTSDNVFRDGSSLQLPSMSGSVADGYVATLTVAV